MSFGFKRNLYTGACLQRVRLLRQTGYNEHNFFAGKNISQSWMTSMLKKVQIRECIPVGCVPSAAVAVFPGGGVSAPGGSAPGVSALGGGVCSGGVSALGGWFLWGVSAGGGVCSQRGLLLGGWYPSMHWGRHPRRVDRHTPVKT